MNFLYSSHGAYLYKSLVNLLSHQEQHNNLLVDAAFNELVKEIMLEKAQFSDLTQTILLKTALGLAIKSLAKELREMEVAVDLVPYVKNAETRLNFVAKEMATLSANARASENHREIPEPLVASNGIPFQISSLAMGRQFNGLFAFALESTMFDLEELRKHYVVEGDWFPATITDDDLLFIVDYSSVLVNMKHLAPDHWSQAKAKLTEMMNCLQSC